MTEIEILIIENQIAIMRSLFEIRELSNYQMMNLKKQVIKSEGPLNFHKQKQL